MAQRSYWKGYLKLSLVTCPVGLTPATTENEKVRFHTVNRKTGNRVASQYVDAVSGAPIDEDDQVKGYQRGEDDFVMLENDELESVALESSRTIDIETFVPDDSVGWIWLDAPHYITPSDAVGEEAYCVIRDAMKATKTAGLSRLVMYRRERAVMLKPRDKGIVLWTLRFRDEIRDSGDYFDAIDDGASDPALMNLMKQMIGERTDHWRPEMASDPVQDKLLELIATRKKGMPRTGKQTSPSAPAPSNVINIMDALRKSISAEGKPRRRK